MVELHKGIFFWEHDVVFEKTWREFGRESRRTSRLRAGELVLRSESTERERLPAHTPSTTPSSSRSLSPSLDGNDIMSYEDSSTSGYTPSVPEAGTYAVPQAGNHEQPALDNTTVTYPTEPTWGTVTHGPASSTFDRNSRSYGMGNNPPPAPSPAQFNGPYPPNHAWGSGAPPAPSQEQWMRFWQLAQTLRNYSLFLRQVSVIHIKELH